MPSYSMRVVALTKTSGTARWPHTSAASSVAACTQLPAFVQTWSAPSAPAHTTRIGAARRSRPCETMRAGRAFEANA